MCSPKQTKDLIVLNENDFNTQSCQNTIRMSSPHVCRYENFEPWFSQLKKMGINKYVVGTLMGLIGLLFLFLGVKYFKISSFILIGVVGALIAKSFLSPYYELPLWGAAIFGIILALITLWFIDLINTILSVIFGFFLANLFYNFLIKFVDADPNTLYLWTLIVCVILSVILFTCFFEKLIILLLTSFIGAYCFVRGISLIIGGFPDETYIGKLISHKEFNQVSSLFSGKTMIYLLAILLLFVLGCMVQGGLNFWNKDTQPQQDKPREEPKEEENEKLLIS
jgi:hypothetical protein